MCALNYTKIQEKMHNLDYRILIFPSFAIEIVDPPTPLSKNWKFAIEIYRNLKNDGSLSTN